MAYCGKRGIPLSRFLGREGGPEWLESDRKAALDWQAYEAQRCTQCGTHPDDVEAGTFHAHLSQCKGCQHRQRVSEAPEAKEGRGVYAVAVPYAAAACPRCKPHDD